MTVSCVIAAFNEEVRVAETVREAARIPGVTEVVVVDDGSRDMTARRAQEAAARVVAGRHAGKADAVRRGIAAARGDILLLLDADLGQSAADGAALLGPVLADEADLVIATFPKTAHRGGFGWAVGIARWGIERLTGRRMTAPLSGQRALRRVILEQGHGLGRGWELEVGMTVDALRAGFRVVEVPTKMGHRLTGRSGRDVAHRAAQMMGVARALWRRWWVR